jgi:hypothetical protein
MGRTLIWTLQSTGARRTAEVIVSFRGVTTGTAVDRLRSRLHRRRSPIGVSPQAAPNTYPRVGRPDLQHAPATAGRPRALETRPFPHAGHSKRRDHAPGRSQFVPGSAGGQPAGIGQEPPATIVSGTGPASGANPSDGVGVADAAVLEGLTVPEVRHGKGVRPRLAPVRPPAPRRGPVWLAAVARHGRRRTRWPCPAAARVHEANRRVRSNASFLRSRA